jgi:hypothetical protein
LMADVMGIFLGGGLESWWSSSNLVEAAISGGHRAS